MIQRITFNIMSIKCTIIQCIFELGVGLSRTHFLGACSRFSTLIDTGHFDSASMVLDIV